MRVRRLLCLLILCSSRAMAAETAAPGDKFVAQRVQEMFQIGFVRGPREIQASQRLYDSLRNAPGSSAIDYAHGLVSLRQMKNKDAQNDFLAATKRPGTPYLPAWEALIWSHFISREYDTAYERVLEFAKLVQKSENLTELTRHEEFYWLGRVMSAAELTSESEYRREIWARAEQRLTNLLDADAIGSYRDGREDMQIRHTLLEEEARQALELAREKEAAQREKKIARMGRSVEVANGRREALQKSATELKESLDEQTAEFRKELQRSEKDCTFLQRRAMSLSIAMLALDQQMIALQLRTKNPAANAARDQAQADLQNARVCYELEYLRIAWLAQQTSTNAQTVNRQMGEFNEQYNEVNSELVQNEEAVQKLKERSLKQADRLKKENAEPKPLAIAKKNDAAKSFRAHIDLDLFAERDKVLNSFGVKTAGK